MNKVLKIELLKIKTILNKNFILNNLTGYLVLDKPFTKNVVTVKDNIVTNRKFNFEGYLKDDNNVFLIHGYFSSNASDVLNERDLYLYINKASQIQTIHLQYDEKQKQYLTTNKNTTYITKNLELAKNDEAEMAIKTFYELKTQSNLKTL